MLDEAMSAVRKASDPRRCRSTGDASETEQSTARQLCTAGHRIWRRGLCAGHDGNLSGRLADGRLLVTPTGVSKGLLRSSSICTVALDGTVLREDRGCAVTSEIKVHLAIYQSRRDVRAIIHAHPPHANAFAFSDEVIPSGVYTEADVVLGRVPTARYAPPGTHELAENVVRVVGNETSAVLMAHHGVVVFSSVGIDDAYAKLEVLDSYCHMLLGAARLGRIEPIGDGDYATRRLGAVGTQET